MDAASHKTASETPPPGKPAASGADSASGLEPSGAATDKAGPEPRAAGSSKSGPILNQSIVNYTLGLDPSGFDSADEIVRALEMLPDTVRTFNCLSDWIFRAFLACAGQIQLSAIPNDLSGDERELARAFLAAQMLVPLREPAGSGAAAGKPACSAATVVAKGSEPPGVRQAAVEAALRAELRLKGLTDRAELDAWMASLKNFACAPFGQDCVLTNQSRAFREGFQGACGIQKAEEIQSFVWDLLRHFIGEEKSFTEPLKKAVKLAKQEVMSVGSGGGAGTPAINDFAGASQQASGLLLSRRLGDGGGADFCQLFEIYNAIGELANEAACGRGWKLNVSDFIADVLTIPGISLPGAESGLTLAETLLRYISRQGPFNQFQIFLKNLTPAQAGQDISELDFKFDASPRGLARLVKAAHSFGVPFGKKLLEKPEALLWTAPK